MSFLAYLERLFERCCSRPSIMLLKAGKARHVVERREVACLAPVSLLGQMMPR